MTLTYDYSDDQQNAELPVVFSLLRVAPHGCVDAWLI